MTKDSSVTSTDILALIAILTAMLMGAIALHLWAENSRLREAPPKARITQTFECN